MHVCELGSIQDIAATVRPVRAIRRFTVRPVLPAGPRAAWATWRATCAGPGTRRRRTSSRAVDPELWESTQPRPGAAARRRRAATRLDELAGDEASSQLAGAAARGPRRATSPTTAGTSGRRPDGGDGARRRSRYFSPEFGITAVLPQYSGGLGILAGDHLKAASDLGVPDHRRRPALPARLLPAVAVPRGLAAGDLPGPRPRRPAALAAARGRRRPRHDRHRDARRRRRCSPGSGWPSVGRVPLLLLDSDVEENPDHYRDVTDRLYGGTSEHRLRQELLLGVGGVRALRAYSRITGAPGARGLPHQRGPRRLPRPRADPRAHRRRGRPQPRLRHRARGLPRLHRLHHPHPGPGGHRPLPARPGRAVLRRAPARPRASRSSGSWRSAPRTTTAATRRSSTWR